MSYLLDTCVVSEPTKPRPAASVVAWVRTARPESLYLSVLTLGELEQGIGKLSDGRRRRELTSWLESVRWAADGRILPVDDTVAIEWGRMLARSERQGQTLPVVDALLGATAIVHGLTVVTRNTSDIVRTGAQVIDPWQDA
jgi:predicted nucleic acid-binding protein